VRLLIRLTKTVLAVAAVLALVLLVYDWPSAPPPLFPRRPHAIPDFRHVFIVMMENRSYGVLDSALAPYLHRLATQYEVDTQYYGVTHVSLPNYVATIAGTTGGTHSDNPTQKFFLPTLANQLDARHISWEGVMGGLPETGYQGNWYPSGSRTLSASSMPRGAVYAKKHDPFMLFPNLMKRDASKVVPLSVLQTQLKGNTVPRFVWVSPSLCQDMHGQPSVPQAACPENNPAGLTQMGDRFLQHWIPAILASAAFRHGPSVVFLTWDEAGGPEGFSPAAVRQWLKPGPAAPSLLGLSAFRLGGGHIPLIVMTNDGPSHRRVALWADHYSLLKTIEAAWHLPYLGHAEEATVPTLWPFFFAPRNDR
jgi:hypothetical protein